MNNLLEESKQGVKKPNPKYRRQMSFKLLAKSVNIDQLIAKSPG